MRNSVIMGLPHKVTILSKTVPTQPSGQKLAEWNSVGTFSCKYVPEKGSVRVIPTSEATTKIVLFLPKTLSNILNYDVRFENITDRHGNSIIPGTFRINQLLPVTGVQGKLHHYVARVETVIEQ